MKPKLIISSYTYFYFLLAFLCGYFKNTCIIFSIVLFHELGHIFFIKLFNYKIDKVILYPFGGMTYINKMINSPVNEELVIAFGGIIFQVILGIIFNLCNINYLFKMYNYYILIFNLLPMYPLDGSKILNLLLEKFCSYKFAMQITNILCFIIFVIFCLYNILTPLKNYLICSFLVCEFFIVLKNQKHLLNRFYLERYLYQLPYKKIVYNKYLDIKSLKKDYFHFFKKGSKYISEKNLLEQIYH